MDNNVRGEWEGGGEAGGQAGVGGERQRTVLEQQ